MITLETANKIAAFCKRPELAEMLTDDRLSYFAMHNDPERKTALDLQMKTITFNYTPGRIAIACMPESKKEERDWRRIRRFFEEAGAEFSIFAPPKNTFILIDDAGPNWRGGRVVHYGIKIPKFK